MNELTQIEKLTLMKLLSKIKYSDFEYLEQNYFANSPIINSILDKLKKEFEILTSEKTEQAKNSGIPEFKFEINNHIGKAIQNRLNSMEKASIETVSNMKNEELEKFARDILGSIKYEKLELKNLIEFLKKMKK